MSRISLFEEIKLSTKKDNEVSKQDWVYNRAIKLLAKGPRSEHELREELKNAALKNAEVGHLDEKIHIEPAFDRLRNKGLLSQDRRSVEILLNFYPHKGDSFFTTKLEKKGIHKTTIEQVMLEKQYPPESERALKVAQERIEDLKQNDPNNLESILETMPTFLSGRGFTEASIRPTMVRVKREHQCLEEVEEGMDTSNKPSW